MADLTDQNKKDIAQHIRILRGLGQSEEKVSEAIERWADRFDTTKDVLLSEVKADDKTLGQITQEEIAAFSEEQVEVQQALLNSLESQISGEAESQEAAQEEIAEMAAEEKPAPEPAVETPEPEATAEAEIPTPPPMPGAGPTPPPSPTPETAAEAQAQEATTTQAPEAGGVTPPTPPPSPGPDEKIAPEATAENPAPEETPNPPEESVTDEITNPIPEEGISQSNPIFLNEQADAQIRQMLELIGKTDDKGVTHTGEEVSARIANYVDSMPLGPDPTSREYLGEDGNFDSKKFEAARSSFREKYKGMGFREPVMPNVYGEKDAGSPPPRKVFDIDLAEAGSEQLDGNMFVPRKGPDGKPIYDPETGKQIQDIIIFENGKPKGYHIMDPKDGCAISESTLKAIDKEVGLERVNQTQDLVVKGELIDDPVKSQEYLEKLKEEVYGKSGAELITGLKSIKSGLEKGADLDLTLELGIDDPGVNLDGVREKAKDIKGNVLVKVPRLGADKQPLIDPETDQPAYDLLIIDKEGKIVGGLIGEPPQQTLIKQKDREELLAALKELEQYQGKEAELAASLGLSDEALAARKASLKELGDDEGPKHGPAEGMEEKKPEKELDTAKPISAGVDSSLEEILAAEKAKGAAKETEKEAEKPGSEPSVTADPKTMSSLAPERTPDDPAPTPNPAESVAEKGATPEPEKEAKDPVESLLGGGEESKTPHAKEGGGPDVDPVTGQTIGAKINNLTTDKYNPNAAAAETPEEQVAQDKAIEEDIQARSGDAAEVNPVLDESDLAVQEEAKEAEQAEVTAEIAQEEAKAAEQELATPTGPEAKAEQEVESSPAKPGPGAEQGKVVVKDGQIGYENADPNVMKQAAAVRELSQSTPQPASIYAGAAKGLSQEQAASTEKTAALKPIQAAGTEQTLKTPTPVRPTSPTQQKVERGSTQSLVGGGSRGGI